MSLSPTYNPTTTTTGLPDMGKLKNPAQPMNSAHVDDRQRGNEIEDENGRQDNSKLFDTLRAEQLHPSFTEPIPGPQDEDVVANADARTPLEGGPRHRTRSQKVGNCLDTEAQALNKTPLPAKRGGDYPKPPPMSSARGAHGTPFVPPNPGKQARNARHDGKDLDSDQGVVDDSGAKEQPANDTSELITPTQMTTKITRLAKTSFNVAEAFARFLRQHHPTMKADAQKVMTALDAICDEHRKRKAEDVEVEAEAEPSRRKGKMARKGKNM